MKKSILIIAIFVVCNLLLSQDRFEYVAKTGLQGVENSSVEWGDYDNDGDMDLIIAGKEFGDHTSGYSFIYNYNSDTGEFVDTGQDLPGVRFGAVAWGDYDNDGDLDAIIAGEIQSYKTTGYIANIYRNDNGSFSDIGAGLLNAHEGATAKWGDYDNDGDLDILLTGANNQSNKDCYSSIYKNNNGSFENINANLPGVRSHSSSAWGDYDNDGDLDIVLTGEGIAEIYKNNGINGFSEINAGLQEVTYSSVDWGDFDNDGYLDLLYIGVYYNESNYPVRVTKIYRNDRGVGFEPVITDIPGLHNGSANWGDFDNDGDLDILLTGNQSQYRIISNIYENINGTFDKNNVMASFEGLHSSAATCSDFDNDGDLDVLIAGLSWDGDYQGVEFTGLYKNMTVENGENANTQPSKPTNLYSSIDGNDVTLHWDKTTDAETPQDGLSYNLYIGSTSGGYDIKSPMSNMSNGLRKISEIGNTGQNTSWTIKDLPDGIYYYGVQAIDHSSTGSEFSGENIFVKGEYTLPEDKIVSLADGCEIRALKGAHIFLQSNFLRVNGTFYLEESVKINAQKGSELIIGAFSSLITLIEPDYLEFTPDNYIEITGSYWKGITCEPFSNVILNRTKISGAEYALKGAPKDVTGAIDDESSCIVEQCEITDCENGISLIDCATLQIKNNSFMGLDMGAAVSLIQSSGEIIGNNIDNYNKGLNIISCSPTVVGNTITNNKYNGVYITGMNSIPRFIDPLNDLGLNNTVAHNGEILFDEGMTGYIILPSQIAVGYGGLAYLEYGRNDIYSYYDNIPCVSAVSDPSIHSILPIFARGNYWGSPDVTDDFFDMRGDYFIIYDDPAGVPFGSNPVGSPITESDSKSYKLLVKALQAELDGKYDKAIKVYLKIIEKYPDSPEALVAYTKLPDNYNNEGLSLEPLISLYDEQLTSDDTRINKKFFKEMKVTTHLKGKKYDEGIAISEEMILEADSEEEVTLCEIDIAIANMMKDHSNKGKSKSNEDHSKTLSDLLAKLNGDEEGDKTDIVETQLPTNFTLYQNYPNPFNPTTEIKFSLPIESNVKLNVYNINGQLVSELANGNKEAGIHAVNFDGNDLNSGMYFYTLEANGVNITKKMVLTK